MKILGFVFISFLVFTSYLFPQFGPGPAYHPFIADGARNLSSWGVPLKWKNPPGATSNDIYIGYDSTKVSTMDPSVKFQKTDPLVDSIMFNPNNFICRFFWRVVEYDGSGSSGTWFPWSFGTKGDNYTYYYDFDDFENFLPRWTITGNQYSRWNISIKDIYQLPEPAYNLVMAVKNTQQGVQNISTATFEVTPPPTTIFYQATLFFSSDLKINGTGTVYIEYSTDNGASWNPSWSSSVSERGTNKSLVLFTNSSMSSISSFLVRLKSDLRDNTSWWAIDRFAVVLWSGVLTNNTFYIYSADETENHFVRLTYGIGLSSPGVEIYRKNGIPSDPGEYSLIKSLQGLDGIHTFIDSTTTDSVYTYYIGTPFSGFSNEGTAYLTGVTPVELTSFVVSAMNEEVLLSWETATETNNKGFHIQRSLNKNNWEELAFINGAGTSVSSHQYSFNDKPVVSGKVYYRLKQEDYAGTSSYSKIEEVQIGVKGYNLSQNYPNPFNPSTTIEYSIPQSGNVILKIFDVLGQEISQPVNEIKEAGTYKVQFNASSLSSGVYFYKLESGSFSQIRTLVLLK